jgi:MSHA biogenesis protein MshI
MATVARAAGGKHVLEACASILGSAPEQEAAIAAWLLAERRNPGAVGSILQADDYQLAMVEAPDVLPVELKAAVRWRLKDVVDFPLDDAVVDVFSIPDQARRSGSKMLYAVVAKRAPIEAHVALLRPNCRRFDVIDIPELALRNLAASLPQAADGLVFLWLKQRSALLLVVKGRKLYLTRFVPFPGTGADSPLVAGPEVDALALEMQRSMDYFESHYEQAPLAHLVIAPRGEYSESLARELSSQTSMRVSLIDLGSVLELKSELSLDDPRSLLAIGGALREDAHEA